MKKQLTWMLTIALAATLSTSALAQKIDPPTGTITTLSGGRQEGLLRWLNASKKYTVTTSRMATEVQLDDVASIDVKKPATLDAAIKKVQSGAAASAIPTLEAIMTTYSRLTWDRVAARWLVDAYVKTGNTAKASKACDAIIRTDESAGYKGEFAVAYWRILMAEKKDARLKLLLEKAIASGDMYSAAFALLTRGNAAMAKGSAAANCTEALKDGYLRVILLYGDVQDAIPEALYMGAKAFDGRQNASRADKLRTQLKASYPTSEWATRP